MKFKLGILICMVVLVHSVGQAQLGKGFGLKVGAVSAKQTWDFQINLDARTQARWGFDAGLFVEPLDLAFLSVPVEFHYVPKGSSLTMLVTTPAYPEGKVSTFQPRVAYVSVPILVKVRLGVAAFTPYVIAGPRLDLLVSRTDDGQVYVFDRLRKTDAGVSIGIGVEIPIQFVPYLLAEFRYSPSFNDAFNDGFLRVKNQSIELLVGVQLQ